MTVYELIKELEQLPASAEVMISNMAGDGSCTEITIIDTDDLIMHNVVIVY